MKRSCRIFKTASYRPDSGSKRLKLLVLISPICLTLTVRLNSHDLAARTKKKKSPPTTTGSKERQ
jgi:hypothetical protein